MSKRRADNQLTNLDREDINEEEVSPEVNTWQERGTASQEQMAGRRIIKAVRKGSKPLVPEEEKKAPTTISSVIFENKLEEPSIKLTQSVVSTEKKEPETSTSTTTTTSTSTTTPITSPVPLPKSPFTFNFGTADASMKWPTFEPTSCQHLNQPILVYLRLI